MTVLKNGAGKDCTEEFEEADHPIEALNLLDTYKIGFVEESSLK